MSASKYADLPDIDTAPDIYEIDGLSPDDEFVDNDGPSVVKSAKIKVDPSRREELDFSNLIDTEEASKKFRKAEQKAHSRTHYAYPSSPTSPVLLSDPSAVSRRVPLSHRLLALQNELSALETELADPSNPLIQKEREEDNLDPGELIRGLVDVRTRLEKIKKGREGRARLVGAVLHANDLKTVEKKEPVTSLSSESKADQILKKSEIQLMVDLDHRVGELEDIIGSTSTTLDEVSPLPPPLLPLIARLNNQFTILTQPRHIDAISRRLKLLLSDLERASAQHQTSRHQTSHANNSLQTQTIQEQLLPLLSRLGPLLAHIPHILMRLRTLSALHSSAALFQTSLKDLEEEQKKVHNGLLDLEKAVGTVERNLSDNRDVVRNNVAGLEARVNSLLNRLENIRSEPS